MAKRFSIVLVIMLGFFLMPTLSYACGKDHKKNAQSHTAATHSQTTISIGSKANSCCDKKTSQTEKKDCCKNKHSQNNNDNDDCNGKCGNSSCHCPAVAFGFILYSSELKYNLAIVPQKQFFLYSDPYISSGYHSIWQPPKIS